MVERRRVGGLLWPCRKNGFGRLIGFDGKKGIDELLGSGGEKKIDELL